MNLKILFIVFLLVVNATSLYGKSREFSEYEIKAGFIYNLARFIKWPKKSFENNPGSFLLCIMGDDPFGDFFQSVEGKSVRGKNFIIKRLNNGNTLKQCQILFISESEDNRMGAIVKSLEGSNVLTVADTNRFWRIGGGIALVKNRERIVLEINLDVSKKAGLQISTKLLEISIIVKGN